MPGELRFDALTGTWVNIVGHRQDRPNLPAAGCPFCVGGLEAPEPYDVRWFANRWPAFAPGAPVDLASAAGAAIRSVPAVGRVRGRAVLARARRIARNPAGSHRCARSSTSGRSERPRCSPGPRSSTCSCSRTAGAKSARRSTIRTARSTAIRSSHRSRRARSTVGCAVCREIADEVGAAERIVATAGDWVAWVPYASAHAYGLRIAPRAHLGSLVALDEQRRNDLARILVDVLGRYDRLWPGSEPAGFPYLLWFHQAPAAEATSGTCTRTSRRRCARPACSATSRRVSSAAERCRTPCSRKRPPPRCAMPEFRAPGRVNLIGGQVDYHEGWVVSMAIDRDVRVVVEPRADGRVVTHSHELEGVVDLAADGL